MLDMVSRLKRIDLSSANDINSRCLLLIRVVKKSGRNACSSHGTDTLPVHSWQ